MSLMIPPYVADDIKSRFPDVKLLHHNGMREGFGVELNGVRNAWLVDGSPEQWLEVRDLALRWLERTSPA